MYIVTALQAAPAVDIAGQDVNLAVGEACFIRDSDVAYYRKHPAVFTVTEVQPAGTQTDASGATVLVGADGVMKRVNSSKNKVAILGNSIVALGAGSMTTNTKWVPATAKALNAVVVPASTLSVLYPVQYKCTTAGTTASGWDNEPEWPTSIGGTVTDGTVVWTAEATTDTPSYRFGWWHIAQALSGQRLDEVYINGLSGLRVAEISTVFNKALSYDPDYIWMGNWLENDTWPGSAPTLSEIQAAWEIYDRLALAAIGRGIVPFIATLLPSGNIDSSSAFTGYSKGDGTKAWYWLNQKVYEFARQHRDKIIFVDLARLYIDTNLANPVYPENTTTYLSASGSGQQLKKTDGIHPYLAADWLIAKAVSAAITANIQAVDHFGLGGLDDFELFPNPMQYGTAGTDGTGITGDVSNSMTANALGTGGAGVCSKVARTDGAGHWLQMAYTASTAGDNAQITMTANKTLPAGFAVGDIVEAIAEVKIAANPTLLTNAQLWLRFISGTPQWVYDSGIPNYTQDIGQFITEDTVFTLRTPKIPISPSTASVNTYTRVGHRGVCSSTVSFGRHTFRKVNVQDIA
jgi:hypothetical protein